MQFKFWHQFVFSRHLLLVIVKITGYLFAVMQKTRTAANMLSEPPLEGNKSWFFPCYQKLYSSLDRHDGVCRWQPKDRRWFIFFMKLPFFVIELTKLETEYTHVVFLFITMRSRNLLQEFIFEHSRGLSSSRIQLLAQGSSSSPVTLPWWANSSRWEQSLNFWKWFLLLSLSLSPIFT